MIQPLDTMHSTCAQVLASGGVERFLGVGASPG